MWLNSDSCLNVNDATGESSSAWPDGWRNEMQPVANQMAGCLSRQLASNGLKYHAVSNAGLAGWQPAGWPARRGQLIGWLLWLAGTSAVAWLHAVARLYQLGWLAVAGRLGL